MKRKLQVKSVHMNHINGSVALHEDYDKSELAATCTGHNPTAAVMTCASYADYDEARYRPSCRSFDTQHSSSSTQSKVIISTTTCRTVVSIRLD